MNTIFGFSKRAVKQREYQNSLISKKVLKVNARIRESLAKGASTYKRYIIFSYYQRWSNFYKNIGVFFRQSYYNKQRILDKTLLHSNYKSKQLYLFYKLRKKLTKPLYNKTTSLVKLGILSSHFVHFISKKNITYQSRSKYKSNINDANLLHNYIWLYTDFIHKLVNTTLVSTFFFTTNISIKQEMIDEDFNPIRSNWFSSGSHFLSKCVNVRPDNLNTNEYTLQDYLLLTKNADSLRNYLLETDNLKKETQLNNLLNIVGDKNMHIVATIGLTLDLYKIKHIEFKLHSLYTLINLYSKL